MRTIGHSSNTLFFAEVHNALSDLLHNSGLSVRLYNDKAETLNIVYRTKASETTLKKLVNDTIKPLIFESQF